MNVYDKEYVSRAVIDRIDVLKARYRMYCTGVNEDGYELSPGSAAVGRSKCKTDIYILQLIDELLGNIQHDFELSKDASVGFDRLVEPYERYRNYRGQN